MRSVRCWLTGWAVMLAVSTVGAATFTEVTDTALPGIAVAPGRDAIPPGFAGGGAVGDCDGDGLPDLYFTGAGHDVLYRNRGDGTFEDVTVAANLGVSIGSRGAAFGDIDNDGDLDLYVTSGPDARHFLYVNDGHCRFTEDAVARGAAVATAAIGRSVSFTDYDRDGYLDVFVSELQSDTLNPGVPSPISHLLHNRGTLAPGSFEDVTAAAAVVLDAVPGPQAGTFASTPRFTDFDGDGWPDLAVASDYQESRLFWNDGQGHFVDGTVAAGVGGDEHGMGATTADFDGDGRLDLFVGSLFIEGLSNATGNRLYRNNGDRTFTDVTAAAGVRDAMWARGGQAFDLDNDGDQDLVVANGANDDPSTRLFVQADLGAVDLAPFANDPLRLWENDGSGRFSETSAMAGIVDTGVGAGVLTLDYDADGDLDVLVLHDPEPPRLWRNDGGNAKHWIDVDLLGAHAPHNGIGAVVTVVGHRGARPLVQEVSASSTYLAQNGSGRLHFGLGAQRTAVHSVTVKWPSGRVQRMKRLAVDGVRQITEDTSCKGKAGRTDADCLRIESERACILALNEAGANVSTVAAKRVLACVAGRPRASSVDACLMGDVGGKLAAAQARVESAGAKHCTVSPSFGPTSAAAVATASAAILRLQDVFGPSLDAALADPRSDPQAAACQAAVGRAMVKLALGEMRGFNRCKARGLAGEEITSAAELQHCLSPSSVDGLANRIGRRVARTCAHTSVAVAFPGKCAAASSDGLFACLREQASCGVCLTLNAADGLGAGCHRFESGVATAYCGDAPAETQSIARQWNEVLLSAIRIDTPRPTVHARNLFHLSAMMWDVWRAYGGGGRAWVTDEAHAADDPGRDRRIAMSFAAYRLLAERFKTGPGASKTQTALQAKMYALGFDTTYAEVDGETPAAVGNRIAAATIAYGLADGANEGGNYADPSYLPVNEPLIVKQPGTTMVDPNRWQPLALDVIISQNGIPLPGKIQSAIGTRWAQVRPFALTRVDPNDVYVDPGPPPRLGDPVTDAAYKAGAARVIALSGELDASDGAMIDISPGVLGNNPLGTNDGTGHAVNPVTGQPYPPNLVPRGDFLRVLAEFWADGPQSETPPGHWNVIANGVSDVVTDRRIAGTGPAVDRLEWDVKLYLALNGAVHDAAIVAWGLKGKYDSVRPISMIRYCGGQGQASDPMSPAYAPDGLPLVPGSIEVITAQTTVAGGRHAALAGHEGEIALHTYPGPPAAAGSPAAGVRWIRAVEWVPYQKRTFVTPAFPAYTSGHSTFSRAAAEVMTLFTASPYFPGGMGSLHAGADTYLQFERGPSVDVELQWGTYYDAADQAGLSRLAGGIHVPADDFTGRMTGSAIGVAAFDKATEYFH